MKKTAASLAVLALSAFCMITAAPRQAGAATVTGKKYSVYIYSQYVPSPAAAITFKADGVLLISTHNGFGKYFAFSNGVAAVFSAPEYEQYKDLFMIMAGALAGNFIYGAGVTLANGVFAEVFLFSGYAATS